MKICSRRGKKNPVGAWTQMKRRGSNFREMLKENLKKEKALANWRQENLPHAATWIEKSSV